VEEREGIKYPGLECLRGVEFRFGPVERKRGKKKWWGEEKRLDDK